MSEEKSSLLVPVLIASVASGGATHVGTRLGMDEVTSASIQDCSSFVQHERRHCENECAVRVLELFSYKGLTKIPE